MIRFLPAFRVGYWSAQLSTVLEAASRWSVAARIDVEVNHGADGTHGAGSLHPDDLAWDLDTVGDAPADLAALYEYLRVWLPEGFDVVWEGDHVHVEWDVHRRSALAR